MDDTLKLGRHKNTLGSLYSCEPEEGFVCKKYHGNKRNYMNSIAILETPAGQDRLYYMASVLSNVLRKNSAQDHRDLAKAVHGMLLARQEQRPAFGYSGPTFWCRPAGWRRCCKVLCCSSCTALEAGYVARGVLKL